VVDFCAGAGGKTLAIGAAMRNTGRIYALDTSVQRLSRLKPRLARSGLSNVWPQAISGQTDSRLSRLRAKADAVLVDAPCSGLGTLRRNPDLKWRITPQSVRELVAQQSAILKSAGRLVKPSGRLVYATCSLLAEENDQLVDQFLLDHPDFRRLSALEVLSAQKILLPDAWQAFTAAGDLWLWPHRSGTDGFFAAVLTRAGDSHQGVG
jgi:16S rRNA (cytosine967-C5)-methyltransferase